MQFTNSMSELLGGGGGGMVVTQANLRHIITLRSWSAVGRYVDNEQATIASTTPMFGDSSRIVLLLCDGIQYSD
jgi:hypothetical protein